MNLHSPSTENMCPIRSKEAFVLTGQPLRHTVLTREDFKACMRWCLSNIFHRPILTTFAIYKYEKLQFIHGVDGEGSKSAKIIKKVIIPTITSHRAETHCAELGPNQYRGCIASRGKNERLFKVRRPTGSHVVVSKKWCQVDTLLLHH